MNNPISVASLFQERPRRWGLRGDPHLWDEMIQRFEGVACPATPEALAALVEEAFAALTGHPVSHWEPFYVEQFAHGGISSGYISPEFWRETALPLLQSRFEADTTTPHSGISQKTCSNDAG